MKALLSTEENKKIKTELVELKPRALAQGEVLIRAEYSSLNYKDALGVTGTGQIFKKNPIIGGIDVAGTVEESKSSNIKKGDFVLVNGGGLGETHDGGYSELVIEHERNVVPRPTHLSAREAMTYGTAGFTAALALERMTQNGQTPEMGPILVTGASGGVGQFAIHFFSQVGYEVHALTGKREYVDQLTKLGAKKVIFTSQLELGDRPLETVRYGGIVDNVGGKTLAKAMAHVQLWGNVACIGMAESPELHTTVLPMILRGVSLLGTSSNNTAHPLRIKIWERMASDLKPDKLEDFVSEVIGLNEVVATAQKMLTRQTHGRTLVAIKGANPNE